MQRFIILIFTFLPFLGLAQEPAHYILGEDELGGIDIYDLFQDQSKNYWIATNEGVFRYDGHIFRSVESGNSLSKSMFNLCEDENGVVHCNNLSGQVFKLQDDSCLLVHQISEKLMYHSISIGFDNLNVLTIATSSLFQVIDGKEELFFEGKAPTFYSGNLLKRDGELLLFDTVSGELLNIKDGSMTTQLIDTGFVFEFYELEDRLISYDYKSSGLYEFHDAGPVKIEQLEPGLRRFYSDGEILWDTEFSGGAYIVDPILKKRSELLFPQTIASTLMRDQEGNILIGTFGEGIIVIPNIHAKIYNFRNQTVKPTRLAAKGENLFVGTQDGKVLQISEGEKPEVIYRGGEKLVEYLHYLAFEDQLLIDDRSAKLLSLENHSTSSLLFMGAIKDVFTCKNGSYVVCSNVGVNLLKNEEGGFTTRHLFPDVVRTNCIAFDDKSGTYYVGESSGLSVGTEDGLHDFLLDDERVLCRNIIVQDDKAYVCTQGEGILVFEGTTLIKRLTKNEGLISDNTLQIRAYKDQFVLATAKGLSLINEDGNTVQVLGMGEGLLSPVVSDMEIIGDFLYLINNKGLQRIDLSQIPEQGPLPEVSLIEFTVNDERIMVQENMKFRHNENRLKIQFQISSLRFTEELQFEYMLLGIDEEWQRSNSADNIVEYKSVPPGDYEFKFRSVLRGQLGETRSMTFEIEQPFWNRWWFFGTLFVLVLISTFFIVKSISNRLKKKAELQRELIASKLTAIQSQMNPHFIFNSLNSIQDLVLKQEGEHAYDYISKFAFLVRKVLQFSDAELIDLEEELKVLKVYLELEQLRFSKEFEFSINCEELEHIQVPPMIVQPFIENAIKHGLLHRKGPKILKVDFLLKGETLTCQIEDNGIGRKRSAEIKRRKSQQHESFSVKSIRSRFDILKSKYGGELGVEFTDLSENEEATGTRVVLKIPHQRKF